MICLYMCILYLTCIYYNMCTVSIFLSGCNAHICLIRLSLYLVRCGQYGHTNFGSLPHSTSICRLRWCLCLYRLPQFGQTNRFRRINFLSSGDISTSAGPNNPKLCIPGYHSISTANRNHVSP